MNKTDNFLQHSKLFVALAFVMLIGLGACRHDNESKETTLDITKVKTVITGDSMVYGLACEGSTDSVIVIYPFSGDDPVTYSTIEAKRDGKIIGQVQIGDWIGIVLNKSDKKVADMVINLDQLKGTWTYSVLPTWKELANMSKKTRQRMENQILAELPDSVKELYFVPREYGFSLKRSSKAQAVGRVHTNSLAEDDSPVEYPQVKNYREWHPWNGKLILISTEQKVLGEKGTDAGKETIDTLDFVYLDNDSLILRKHDVRYGFHRKESAISANAEAQKAAQKADQKSEEELKAK